MRVTSLQLQNFRFFESMEPIGLDQINVFIGPNNAGKSSILRALHSLQHGCNHIDPDVRINTDFTSVIVGLDKIDVAEWHGVATSEGKVEIKAYFSVDTVGTAKLYFIKADSSSHHISQINNLEPYHFIIPYLSKRKTARYQEDVRKEHVLRIGNDISYLAAKLSRLANPAFPYHERYSNTCKKILGFVVTAIPSANGQRPGIYLPDLQTMPIDQMGEGVPNIVALLADLALSSGKLFLIEEPENDLHPQST